MIIEKKPLEVWDALKADKDAVLIDVRTPEEWERVGYPDLSSLNRGMNRETIRISLQDAAGNWNENFLSELNALGLRSDQPLYFICLIGGRSRIAATLAKKAGFTHVYNVQEGFEGHPDQQGKRGTLCGWLAAGLPRVFPEK